MVFIFHNFVIAKSLLNRAEMKKKINILVWLSVVIVILSSCKQDEVPVLTTVNVDGITAFTANCSVKIINDGGAIVTSHGVCWSTNEYPTITDDLTTELHEPVEGVFISYMYGLNATTIYYVRAYATNSAGTGYSEQIQFITLVDKTGQTGIVNDIEGNTYTTIGIGSQIWMAENLKTTRYNDGTAIPNITIDATWAALTSGAYCDYDNNIANSEIYGRLYNWYVAASDNPKKVCPVGWHVPDWAELSILPNIHEGYSVTGGKLKEIGTIHWNRPNTVATNETGFTALPGGHRDYSGTFNSIGNYGFWWSSTDYHQPTYGLSAWSINLSFNNGDLNAGYSNSRREGFSIRCLKD
jgi:uncharacterized protein (TIGR02145 family)